MAIILRILGGVLVLILVLSVGLALSIPIDAYLQRNTLAEFVNTSFPSTDEGVSEVRAYVAEPEDTSEPLPAIVMIHEFWGIREDMLGKADALSEEGYVVVVPDTFRGSTTKWLPRAIWQTIRTPLERVNQDLDTVFAALAARDGVDPERIMVMGFCYGGGKALEYALHNPQVNSTAVFYGTLITDVDRLESLPGPVLGVFGRDDASIPVADVQAFEDALSAANIPHEVTVYDDVGHAFVGDIRDIRAGGQDQVAWQTFVAFSAAQLKEGF